MLETGDRNHSWFALCVKPRHEKTTAWALRSKGFEEFLPLHRRLRRWSDRLKELDEPLFSRYVFCRFDARDRLPVLRTPGVVSIVGIAGNPAPVADGEIAALQAIVKSGLTAQPWPFLQLGQLVRIEAGPLSGLEGILLDWKSRHRLIVSVTLLQRSVAVEIDRLWVTPIGTRGRLPVKEVASPFAVEVKTA